MRRDVQLAGSDKVLLTEEFIEAPLVVQRRFGINLSGGDSQTHLLLLLCPVVIDNTHTLCVVVPAFFGIRIKNLDCFAATSSRTVLPAMFTAKRREWFHWYADDFSDMGNEDLTASRMSIHDFFTSPPVEWLVALSLGPTYAGSVWECQDVAG